MSINRVKLIVNQLPRRTADDVLGYVRSVERALPNIFREANVEDTSYLRDSLLLIAGLKKLHSLQAFAYWTMRNSLKTFRSDHISGIQLGSWTITTESAEYVQCRTLKTEFDNLLRELGVSELIRIPSYVEILQVLSNES